MPGETLLEREAELETLGKIVAASRSGLSGVVAIEGPSGIGKTSLLGGTLDLTTEAGLTVLEASCGQLEEEFPFGAVRQLFE